jgi:hypothetical protein
VVCTDWYECRHLSRGEFYRLFPFREAPPLDGGFEGQDEATLARLGVVPDEHKAHLPGRLRER